MKVYKKILSILLLVVLSFNTVIALEARSAKIEYIGKVTSSTGSTVGRFKVNGQWAFCVDHAKTSPPSNTSYDSGSIYNNESIRAILYYGYGGIGNEIGTSNDAWVATTLALDSVMNNPQVDWLANAKAQEKISEADRQAMDAFEKAHPDIVKNLKQTGDVASFVADFIPVAGDIKSFAEAEDGIDYALAFIGVVPGSEVIVKPLKAAKASIQKAKVAESLGNTADVIKHQKEAVRYIDNSVNGIYDSKEFRKAYEDIYGKANVRSTTQPPEIAKNVKLAGKRHPITGIPFDSKGFPIFDDIAKYDTKLNLDYYRSLEYTEQMKAATKEMREKLGDSEIMKRFDREQIKAIQAGDAKIPGYTWHHHQDTGRMQLVPEWDHSKTGHVGGDYIQKGK